MTVLEYEYSQWEAVQDEVGVAEEGEGHEPHHRLQVLGHDLHKLHVVFWGFTLNSNPSANTTKTKMPSATCSNVKRHMLKCSNAQMLKC